MMLIFRKFLKQTDLTLVEMIFLYFFFYSLELIQIEFFFAAYNEYSVCVWINQHTHVQGAVQNCLWKHEHTERKDKRKGTRAFKNTPRKRKKD